MQASSSTSMLIGTCKLLQGDGGIVCVSARACVGVGGVGDNLLQGKSDH